MSSSDFLELVDSGEVAYVPDGDPCPKHGLPTRLLWTSTGLFSQCQGCRDAFLDWFADHTKHVVRVIDEVAPYRPAEGAIDKRVTDSFLRRRAAGLPPQSELAL